MRKFLLFFLFPALCLITIGCSKPPPPSYRIGIDPTFYPLDDMGKGKNILGYTRELLEIIAKDQNLSFELITVSWDVLESGLKEKKYQAILSSLQPLPFNKEIYHFSDLYLATGPVLIMRYGTDLDQENELQGKEIAVQAGSITSIRALEKFPGIIIRTYDSIPSALNDAAAFNIDGAIVGNLGAKSYVQDLYYKKLQIMTPPLDDEGLRLIALIGRDQSLFAKFNKSLESMKKSGKYQELLQKWNLASSE